MKFSYISADSFICNMWLCKWVKEHFPYWELNGHFKLVWQNVW